mmetsp:Transcript_48918/g.79394  ORF Transcript_48918/g.79394 Transcript_48918/m.79394 type:complete len:141 (+) Transcript_48918:76-498(+)
MQVQALAHSTQCQLPPEQRQTQPEAGGEAQEPWACAKGHCPCRPSCGKEEVSSKAQLAGLHLEFVLHMKSKVVQSGMPQLPSQSVTEKGSLADRSMTHGSQATIWAMGLEVTAFHLTLSVDTLGKELARSQGQSSAFLLQ